MKSELVATLCLDILVIADCIKTSLHVCRIGLSVTEILLALFSLTRAAAFILEKASLAAMAIRHGVPPHPTATSLGIASIWESPVAIASPEKLDELGPHFSSGRLWRRFNAIWLPPRGSF